MNCKVSTETRRLKRENGAPSATQFETGDESFLIMDELPAERVKLRKWVEQSRRFLGANGDTRHGNHRDGRPHFSQSLADGPK